MDKLIFCDSNRFLYFGGDGFYLKIVGIRI